MQQFDLVVIGGGPAGYVASIRAAQLGMKVACVEKRSTLGGTCLNEGCIPSKALLNSSEKFEEASKHFAEIGIDAQIKLNLAKMLAKKDSVVSELCRGIDGLFAKNKVTRFKGLGKITAPDKVVVQSEDGLSQELQTKNILLATGSEVMKMPGIEVDEEYIVSSTGALDIKEVPKSLVVIGGGYIGLELGSVWRRLGAEVTVVEYFDRIVPALDQEIGKQFHKSLAAQGINFLLSTKVETANVKNKQVVLKISNSDGSNSREITADKVLVSIGRKPFTAGLGLENVGIVTDERGRIQVNKHFQTTITNIYAVGDLLAGPMLAHKAEEEGIAAVEIMAGQAGHVNYQTIPSVVYTSPEVASVGATEEEVKASGVTYKIGKFPFMANGRAKAMNHAEGFVKIIARADNDEVLGAHIIGPDAGTLIAEIALAMEFKAAAEDIARTCHAHPTLNEAVKEAAMAVDKKAIHF